MATEIFLNFDKEIDEFFLFSLLNEDNSEMIAYVLSSANKIYPNESLNEAEDMNIWNVLSTLQKP